MPFVKLDGVTIPIRDDGSKIATKDMGDADRVVGGSYARTARAFKRSWKLRTPLLEAQDARRVSEFLRARGPAFRFGSIVSEGGLAPVAGCVYTLRGAPGGGTSVPTPILNERKFDGAVAVDLSTTNLLTDNVATACDTLGNTTGFNPFDGATLSVSALRYMQGARSLQVLTSATVNGTRGGVTTGPVTVPAQTVCTASFYVLCYPGATPRAIRAWLWDTTNGVQGPLAVVTPIDGIWQRVTCQVTTGVGVASVYLYILEDVADQAARFLLDALQVEIRTHATSWVLPSTPRAGGVLRYSAGALRSFPSDGAFTALAWVRRPDLSVGVPGDPGTRAIFDIRQFVSNPSEVVNFVRVETPGGGSNALQFRTRSSQRPALDESISGGAMTDPNAWYHVAAVLRPSPKAGEHKRELWFNGSLVAYDDPTRPLPVVNAATYLSIGGDEAPDSRPWSGGEIADLAFYPIDLSPTMIAELYASGVAQAREPRHLLEGSIIAPETSAAVLASVEDERYQTLAGRPNARAVAVSLEEV
jgi:hypothetical protein